MCQKNREEGRRRVDDRRIAGRDIALRPDDQAEGDDIVQKPHPEKGLPDLAAHRHRKTAHFMKKTAPLRQSRHGQAQLSKPAARQPRRR